MTETKVKPSLPLWRRILLGLIVLLMAGLVGLMVLSYLMERQLGADIVRVNRAGEPTTFDAVLKISVKVKADDSATVYYAEALSGMNPGDLENLVKVNIFYRKSITSSATDQISAELRQETNKSLTALRPLLEKFDKAAELPLGAFGLGLEKGRAVYGSSLKHVQKGAFLLSLRTLELILADKDDAAVSSVVSTLKMIRVFDSLPNLVLHASQMNFMTIACDDIRLLLERGRASEESLAKLQKVLSETTAPDVLEKVFLTERDFQMEMGRNLMPEKIALQYLSKEVPDLPERISLPGSSRVRLAMRRRSIKYFKEMARLIEVVRLPWPEPLEIIPVTIESEKPNDFSQKAIFIRLTANTLALKRSTIVAIAIKRYEKSKGKLPESLGYLVDSFIESIPLDPFTGKELLYQYDEESYAAYSTGANRHDDNGFVIRTSEDEELLDVGIRIGLVQKKY